MIQLVQTYMAIPSDSRIKVDYKLDLCFGQLVFPVMSCLLLVCVAYVQACRHLQSLHFKNHCLCQTEMILGIWIMYLLFVILLQEHGLWSSQNTSSIIKIFVL